MAELLRVSIGGSMPGGEVWSVNPVYSIGGDLGVPVSAAQASTIANAILAIAVPTGLRNINASSVNFSTIRVEARSLAGVLETQAEAVRGTPTSGTGTNTHPYQTSLVTSLRSAQPGARGRGRLYWPCTGLSISNTSLRVLTADVVSVRDSVKTYLSGIESAIEVTLTGVSLAVWSRATPDLYPVTSIQVGDVLDVQRRRRDQTIENYSSVAYP